MTKVIRVKFSNGDSHMAADEKNRSLYHREYDYFLVHDDVEVKEGSLAVVEVSGILKIVAICGVFARSSKATKHAITVFSLDKHKELLKKKEDIQTLKDAILARADEARERKKLKELAENDEGLAAMLKELESLESGS